MHLFTILEQLDAFLAALLVFTRLRILQRVPRSMLSRLGLYYPDVGIRQVFCKEHGATGTPTAARKHEWGEMGDS